MGPYRCDRARRRGECRGELISAPRAEISADQLDLCWGRGYKPLSAPTASAGDCPVTIGAFARERSERVPDRSPGETVMADGDRVLALKNRRAGLLKPPDVRAIRRVCGERSLGVHRDDDRD